jgi:ribonuclease Y
MRPDIITVVLVTTLIGAISLLVVHRYQKKLLDTKQQLEQERMDAEYNQKVRDLELSVKDEIHAKREVMDKELFERRKRVSEEEGRMEQRRSKVDRYSSELHKRENELNKLKVEVEKKNQEIDDSIQTQLQELQRIAGLTTSEAKDELMRITEKESRDDMVRMIRSIEKEAKSEGENRARKLLVLAMQRVSSDQVSEHSTTTVPIPSDDIKGRIIGRNGRNIRSFEQVAGVDVVVDGAPDSVMVASFDPVRREVARRALSKLILDGRIHPAQIEKVVSESRAAVEVIIKEEGEKAAYDAGVLGLQAQIVRLLGKLKFRTSYGQDQHAHAVETALIAGVIAAEIGADVDIAKTGGLLHDIGKAVDHEVSGTHAAIGAEICRRYGISSEVCNTIAAHHHEVDQESVEATIVEVADAISGSRPGARRENFEQYVKRIRSLEEIANSAEGVKEAFALQAGREVRLIVSPDQVDDLEAIRIAKDVARKAEENLQYPGRIKVTVIRETRAVHYAE